MVDFIFHVLLRYYESPKRTRDERVKDSLETVGASILVGGLASAVGVLPLAFTTNVLMRTVFTNFLALIALGLAYGLVFLPVVLSFVGPICVIEQSDPLAGTDDLALKNECHSATGQSDDNDSDKDVVVVQQQQEASSRARVEQQPSTNQPVGIATAESETSHRDVLHSTKTYRDESLEVVRWNEAIAWI